MMVTESESTLGLEREQPSEPHQRKHAGETTAGSSRVTVGPPVGAGGLDAGDLTVNNVDL